MTYKLKLPILEDGYSVQEPASGVVVPTKGGMSRGVADLDDAALSVSVTWQLSENTFNYLISFFKTGTAQGSLPFCIDLIVDDADLVEHEAFFSSAGPQLNSVVGLNYFVTDTLEVTPLPVDEAFDESIMAVYAASNGDPLRYLDLFNIIVNVNWPT